MRFSQESLKIPTFSLFYYFVNLSLDFLDSSPKFRLFGRKKGSDGNHPRRSLENQSPRENYFKNPLTISSSASFSVRPNVISLISCSPAIFPIAASWINVASG